MGRENIDELERCCAETVVLFRRGQPAPQRCCLRILELALQQHDEQAWSAVRNCFMVSMRGWVKRHHLAPLALQHESDEYYAHLTFVQVFEANQRHSIEVRHLPAVLKYMQQCVNTVLLMELRRQRHRLLTESLPDVDDQIPAPFQDPSHAIIAQETWRQVLNCCANERERRVMDLRRLGYAPREIVERFSMEFPDVKEVYLIQAKVARCFFKHYREQEEK